MTDANRKRFVDVRVPPRLRRHATFRAMQNPMLSSKSSTSPYTTSVSPRMVESAACRVRRALGWSRPWPSDLTQVEHQQPVRVESVQEVAGRERRIVEVFEDRRHDDHVEARDALEAGQRLAELASRQRRRPAIECRASRRALWNVR